MAIAEVGAGTQRAMNATASAVDTLALAFPGNVTAGNLLVVPWAGWKSAAYLSAVITDTLGTTYTNVMCSAIGWSGGNGVGGIAYGIAPSSGACTVTVNPAGNGTIILAVDEFSGVDATTPLDVDGGSSSATSNSASDDIVTGVDGALVAALMLTSGASMTLGGTGYTQIYEQEAVTGHPSATAFKVAGAAGAETATWSLSSSRIWVVQTLSFKPAGAAPAATGLPYHAHYAGRGR